MGYRLKDLYEWYEDSANNRTIIKAISTGKRFIFNDDGSLRLPDGGLDLGGNALTNVDWANSDAGSGSGLDADTVDGSEPSNLNVNDADTVDGKHASDLGNSTFSPIYALSTSPSLSTASSITTETKASPAQFVGIEITDDRGNGSNWIVKEVGVATQNGQTAKATPNEQMTNNGTVEYRWENSPGFGDTAYGYFESVDGGSYYHQMAMTGITQAVEP